MHIALMAVGLLILMLLWPLLVVWALNTLFMLTIPYSLTTWFAVFVLMVTFSGTRAAVNKKD